MELVNKWVINSKLDIPFPHCIRERSCESVDQDYVDLFDVIEELDVKCHTKTITSELLDRLAGIFHQCQENVINFDHENSQQVSRIRDHMVIIFDEENVQTKAEISSDIELKVYCLV